MPFGKPLYSENHQQYRYVCRYECLLASLCIARIISKIFLHANYHIVNCNVQNIVAHSEIKLRDNQMLNIQQMYEVCVMFVLSL